MLHLPRFALPLTSHNQGVGGETRYTLGSRFFGSPNDGKWDCEGHLQFGTFATGDILAWPMATQTRYTRVDLPLKPYLEPRANAIGPRNLLNLHPIAGVDLVHFVGAELQLRW